MRRRRDLVVRPHPVSPARCGRVPLRNGDDLRRDPLAVRKATLASLLARVAPGLRFNEHLDEKDGLLVFAQACKLGLEGIVSKSGATPIARDAHPTGS